MYRWLNIVFYIYLFSVCVKNEPLRSTAIGDIQGYYMKTREGRTISAFTSIPYAEPPVGELRFKAPIPVSSWEGTLNASKVSPICVQRNPYIRQKEIVGQEDCLYLNIYTPFLGSDPVPEDKLLPVMVFIHGGGWMCGDATTFMYGPAYLLDRNVLLVAMNYRLGPLGFLSTFDKNCPGNNGLKDQQEALRFIQKTIKSFGGDPNSVTIFGESAGGASVNYHMLSETSAGLFHKAISESGTALVPWAEAPPGEAINRAFQLAKLLDCPQAPSDRMIECLRTLNSYDIIETEFNFYTWDYEPMTPFKAVVEPDLPGAFITRSPRSAPSTSLVPWLTGVNKDEGCLKSVWITAYQNRYNEFITGFDAIAPVTFYYDNSPYPDLITNKLRSFYFGETHENSIYDIDEAYIKQQILQMYSDSYFVFPEVEAVELALNYTKNPVYLYELTYRAVNSFSQIFGDPIKDYGVCHADELMYLFPINFLLNPLSEKDKEMSELILTLWTNFATSGNPNKPLHVPFHWKPATSGKNMEYLDIGNTQEMKRHLGARSRFWSNMPLWQNIRTRRIIDEL